MLSRLATCTKSCVVKYSAVMIMMNSFMTHRDYIIFLDLKLRDRFKFKASVIISFCLIEVVINADIVVVHHADRD